MKEEQLRKLSGIFNDLIGSNHTHNTQRQRIHPSVAVDSPKQISYYTKGKLDYIQANQDSIRENLSLGPAFTFFTPDLRQKYAIMAKPGKVIAHIRPDFTAAQVQERVAAWYSKVQDIMAEEDRPAPTIEISNDIRRYYSRSSYYEECGTLGNSCMKYNQCQDYIDFYDNYDVQIAILKRHDGYITGRALIWNDVSLGPYEHVQVMDRIYTCDHNDEYRFKEFARQNGIYTKRRQSYEYKRSFVAPDGTEFKADVTIEALHEFSLRDTRFPYMDTFTYLDGVNFSLSNCSFGNCFSLCSTGGGFEGGFSICEVCGGACIDDYIYVSGHKEYHSTYRRL